ncbi:MAG TPA: sigma-54 dependent transcriptional regulator [Blastocatellia bacterium]|nr:sigma-54 dependent transcriptional regulator [Blastocatellia bacterium]
MRETSILLLDPNLSGGLGRELCDVLSCTPGGSMSLRREILKDARSAADIIEREDPDLVCLVSSDDSHRPMQDLLRRVREALGVAPLMVVTEAREPGELFTWLQLGVNDFITPPLKTFDLLPRIWRLLDQSRYAHSVEPKVKEQMALGHLIGQSQVFRDTVDKLPFIAQCDSSVLISGETGTGKEVCARAIHYLGPRRYRAFIPVNCGAVPTELMENELFGHARGAFTDAASAHDGLIHEADGGTLFLDEIDALSLAAQVKLLRFIQDKEYRPLGSARLRRADVRIIAAANVEFNDAVVTGRLRRDLYYRLNVIPLHLPPLRERRDDIPLLAHHFLARYSALLNRPDLSISVDAMTALMTHDWPGNVRELEHLIERAVALSRQNVIQCADIGLARGAIPVPNASFREAKAKLVAQFEYNYIQELLSACQGNVSQAARAAQKNRRALLHLIRKYHIDVKPFRANSASAK